ncbi:hypothetical protein HQ560_04615, partial [bacterium]|nr:hypothetical protein [bacterium]
MTGRALLLCTLLAGGLATAANDPVLALWEFESGAELADASGNGHTLKLRGQARVVKSGRSGGGLESFPAGQGNDKAQGAITVKKHPDLSPQGAFTL